MVVAEAEGINMSRMRLLKTGIFFTELNIIRLQASKNLIFVCYYAIMRLVLNLLLV